MTAMTFGTLRLNDKVRSQKCCRTIKRKQILALLMLTVLLAPWTKLFSGVTAPETSCADSVMPGSPRAVAALVAKASRDSSTATMD